VHIEQVALIVEDYDEAIAFFVDLLGFELVEDSPALTSRSGKPKRWVVVQWPATAGTCSGRVHIRVEIERGKPALRGR
jgi:catechol 2,3-dioxygenase-like lactoylglutathione lyase family enzyme